MYLIFTILGAAPVSIIKAVSSFNLIAVICIVGAPGYFFEFKIVILSDCSVSGLFVLNASFAWDPCWWCPNCQWTLVRFPV